MQIDQNLSNFSDIAVQTAFVVYCVALFMSLFYYGRMQGSTKHIPQHNLL